MTEDKAPRFFIGAAHHAVKRCYWLCIYDNLANSIFWPDIPEDIGREIALLRKNFPNLKKEDFSCELGSVDEIGWKSYEFVSIEGYIIFDLVEKVIREKIIPACLWGTSPCAIEVDMLSGLNIN
jgi:hypothetical protein